MRLASTIGKLHTGEWEIIASPDVTIPDQTLAFQALLGKTAHEKYSVVRYHEDGFGEPRVLRFLSPADAKAKEDARNAEIEAIAADLKKQADAQKAAADALKAKADDERQEQVDRANAKTAESTDAKGQPTKEAAIAKAALDKSPRLNRGAAK